MTDQPVPELVWLEVEISANNHEIAAVTCVSDELTQLQALDGTMSFMFVHRIILRMQLAATTHIISSF